MAKINYEISDQCKECIKRHLKQKGEWKINCIPIPKEMDALTEENIPFYPLEKIFKEKYKSLNEDDKLELQLEFNRLLWAKEFLGWSPQNDKKGFYQYYQKEFLLCTAKNRVMRFGRRLGKCVEEDSLVLTSNRGLVKAKNLRMNSDYLVTYDEKTEKIYYTNKWVVENNGYKECVRITLESGKEDTVTLNHPYYNKEKKWIEAQDLKVGDRVAVPVGYSRLNDKTTSCNLALYKQLGETAAKNEVIGSFIFKSALCNINFFVDAVLNSKKKFKNYFFVQQLKHLMQRASLKYKIIKDENGHYSFDVLGKYHTNKEYVYEKIVSIESVGIKKTLAISVPETKTFITNDIITHNTESMSVDCLHFAFTNAGTRTIIVAPFLNLVTEIFDRLSNLLSNSAYAGQFTRKKSPFEQITLPNGSVIKGFTTGLDGNSLRGQSADRLYIDETAYQSEDAFAVFMAFKMDNRDVSFTSASTPSSLETTFKKWCLSDPTWKEFHYSSEILPNFETEYEPEFRSTLTEDAYKLEVQAEFVEGSDKVFKSYDLKKASYDYSYVHFREELPNPNAWKIAIGTDYNSFRNGVQICVLGFNPNFKEINEKPFKILKLVSLTKESTNGVTKDLQTETVEMIKKIHGDFKADWVYCDQGYGGLQNEILSKYFFDIGLPQIFQSIDFNSTYQMTDIYSESGATINKRKKVMMVNFIQKRFEQEEIMFSKKEEPEEKKDSLYHQLAYYSIVRYDNKDQPVFGGPDHKLDALMLANFAIVENMSEIFNPVSGSFVSGVIRYDLYANAGVDIKQDLRKPLQNNGFTNSNTLHNVNIPGARGPVQAIKRRRRDFDIGGGSGGFFSSI